MTRNVAEGMMRKLCKYWLLAAATLPTAAVFTTILSAPTLPTTRLLELWRRSGRHRSPLGALGRGLRYGSRLRPVGCDL